MITLRAIYRMTLVTFVIIISLIPTSMLQIIQLLHKLSSHLHSGRRYSATLSRIIQKTQVLMVHYFSRAFCAVLHLKVSVYHYLPEGEGASTSAPTASLQRTTDVSSALASLRQKKTSHHTLILANHISFIDVVIIGSQFKTSFLAKNDVLTWPLIGWMIQWAGIIFVRRECVLSRIQAMRHIKKRLIHTPVCLFPEGTTTDTITPDYHKWHSGNVWCVAGEEQALIIPLSVCYQNTADNAWVGELSFITLLARIARRRSTTVHLIWSSIPAQSPSSRGASPLRSLSLHALCRITMQSLACHRMLYSGAKGPQVTSELS